MRRTFFILTFLLAWLSAGAQPAPVITLETLKGRDLSTLWVGAIPLLDREQDTTAFEWAERWEPIGYIGRDFRRFYLHIDRMGRDSKNPLCYRLQGKTRVGKNICRFEGTLTIDSLKPAPEQQTSGGITSAWQLQGHYSLHENPEDGGSGIMEGIHTLSLAQDPSGNIYYDTMNFVADGYSNNQWQGTWRSYKTGAVEPCNWGDLRIPDSGQLDIGAAEFSPAEEYIPNGWQNYSAMLNGDPKALAEERRVWWKE